VGTEDRGIHNVRDLLTETLEWNPADVEMLNFDNKEPLGELTTLLEGQQAPTAARFKQKFSDLVRSAKQGDVRFIYIDVHGATQHAPGLEIWIARMRDGLWQVETVGKLRS
jgi:hypothetical protein